MMTRHGYPTFWRIGLMALLALLMTACGGGGGSDGDKPAPPATELVASFTQQVSGLEVSLDASGSTGDIASYQWDFGDGATGSGKSASHSYAAAGTYSVTLTVTDDQGATASKSASVSVVTPNVAPTAAFSHTAKELVASFDASASNDSDGSIASYSWNFGDGATGSGKSASHSYAAAGTYSVTLIVTDDKGATASKSASIGVVKANVAPTAAFTHSEADLVASFDASGSSDSDGSIAEYEWDFGDGNVGLGKNSTHTYLDEGTYTVRLRVIDTQGATTDAILLVTLPPPNYLISVEHNSGGMVNETSLTIKKGERAKIGIHPDEGYAIYSVSGCQGKLDGDVYITGDAIKNCTVSVEFYYPEGLIWPTSHIPVSISELGLPDVDGNNVAFNCLSPGYQWHTGTDIRISNDDDVAGTAVYAAYSGEVIFASDGKYDQCPSSHSDCQPPRADWVMKPGAQDGYAVCTDIIDGQFYCSFGGNVVIIRHETNKHIYATLYAHFKKGSITVSNGQHVTEGDKIGEIGSSGNSTGPHLHFELWGDGFAKYVDPWQGPCGVNMGGRYWRFDSPWRE